MKKLAILLIAACWVGQAAAQDVYNPQTNASQLSTGTLPAGRMPALTGDCTTSAGAVATTCTSINGVNQTTAWNAFTSTITSTSGTLTSVNGVGRWKNLGKTCFISIDIQIITNGTGATALAATLPAGACATASGFDPYVLTGVDRVTNGKALSGLIDSGGTSISRIVFFDGTYPGGSGVNLTVTGVYEAN